MEQKNQTPYKNRAGRVQKYFEDPWFTEVCQTCVESKHGTLDIIRELMAALPPETWKLKNTD